MIELKSCPFCGKKAHLFVDDGVRVICSSCRASTKCLADGWNGNEPMGNATESVIEAWNKRYVSGDTSDGYHTFNELYDHRAILFSVIVSQFPHLAWKSKRHHNGSMFDGMFIVGINTPDGQATYHYDLDPYWNMFECQEVDSAPEWDGHTPDDAIKRIATLRRMGEKQK